MGNVHVMVAPIGNDAAKLSRVPGVLKPAAADTDGSDVRPIVGRCRFPGTAAPIVMGYGCSGPQSRRTGSAGGRHGERTGGRARLANGLLRVARKAGAGVETRGTWRIRSRLPAIGPFCCAAVGRTSGFPGRQGTLVRRAAFRPGNTGENVAYRGPNRAKGTFCG